MKRLLFALLAAGSAVTLAAPSAAAPFLTQTAAASAIYGNSSVTCASSAATSCPFTDTITFTTPAGYNLESMTLSSTMAGTDAATNIDFTSVTLNGVNFATVITGFTELRVLMNQALVAGATNTLIVSGTTGGRASYAGTMAFTNATAVPEAATWAMMIAGFGMIGGAMRRRRTIAAFA